MTQVVTLGELLISFRIGSPARIGSSAVTSFVGAESNVAIGLARLGHSVSWIGVVGSDTLSNQIMKQLRAEGVNDNHVEVTSRSLTGLVTFDSPLDGVRRVNYFRQDSAGSKISGENVKALYEIRPKIIHLSGVTAAISQSARKAMKKVFEIAREIGAEISFDVNYRAALWSPDEAAADLEFFASNCDILFASRDELSVFLGPDFSIQGLSSLGPREIILKGGPAGATLYTPEGEFTTSWERREVVDPVGSGDAFASGYLSARLEGLPPEQRLRRGHSVAAFVVANDGDWEGLPSREELQLVENETDVLR